MTQDTAHRIRQVWDNQKRERPEIGEPGQKGEPEFAGEVAGYISLNGTPCTAQDVAEALIITNYFAGRQQP